MSKLNVTIVDSSVGNRYSIDLCAALSDVGVGVRLITPVNRVLDGSMDFEVLRWMPSKAAEVGKAAKLLQYVQYLVTVFLCVFKGIPENRLFHFQFFRRERIESALFPVLRVLGANLVFTAHNVMPHEHLKWDRWLRLLVYRFADVIIVHSEYIKRKLARAFKVAEEKIRVIPHGDCDDYVPAEPFSKADARARLGLPVEKDIALFFGFIREYKGLGLLLDAYELCQRKGDQLGLVIAGAPRTPELERRYKSRIAEISTDGTIVFHPEFIPSEEVATYFLASDVVILPYKEIDHSAIFHLAYSFGRPLIATSVGDFPEVIEDGWSGYLLRENTAECLAETMLRAFSDRDKLEKMGAYARHLSETKYSWRDAARQTMGVYEEVADAH